MNPAKTALVLFAPCPRGLEKLLAEELAFNGATSIETVPGGARFNADLTSVYRINLWSRIATRVLLQLSVNPYKKEQDIYDAAFVLPWHEWFTVSNTIRVYMTAVNCPFKSIDFITLRVKDAVCDRFRKETGERPSVDTRAPDMRIHVYLDADSVTLYLDTSGEPLFKRGARVAPGDAALKENLAAGVLRLTGWQPGTPLLDPMCGSGTFLIEAAQMWLGIAPGLARAEVGGFAFEKFRNFEASLWEGERESAEKSRKPVEALPIFGCDLYGDALKNAHENLEKAGLLDCVALKQANVLEVSAPEKSGVLVMNPPYGVRIGEQNELAELYPVLGDALKKKFSGWNAYIFTADMRLPKLMRLTASKRIPLFNGKLECRLFEYKVVAGGMRKQKAGEATSE